VSIININPEAEVKTGFAPVKPGTYQIRVKEVTNRNPEKNDLKVVFEFVQPSTELLGIDNNPLKGNAGSLFDYVMLEPDKQWKLRQLIEACGMPWADFDEMELQGKELYAIIKTEPYEGEIKNKINRYVVPAK
jgi:hypothetical protein